MSKIILVAESGADIPRDYSDENIVIVPMHVMMDGRCLDDGTFPETDIFAYYQRTKEIPTTSAPGPEEYQKAFLKIHEEHPDGVILHLCYSAATSATMQNARIASDGLDYVEHVDTKCVSAGQAAIVIRTAEYLKTNPDADIETVKAQVDQWIRQSRMSFIPAHLEYLRAGGRVSNAAYMGATLLKLKPVIDILDGKLICTQKYRGGMNKVFKRLIEEKVEKYHYIPEYIYLIYADGLSEEIKQEAEQLMAQKGYPHVSWIKTGATVSVHGGPGAFGICGFEGEA